MGFTTHFIARNTHFPWPDWFKEKWKEEVSFDHWGLGPRAEGKHFPVQEFAEDIQKAITWDDKYSGFDSLYKGKRWNNYTIYFAPECGGIQCVHITKEEIWTTWPTLWEESDRLYLRHGDQCYDCKWAGCSDNPFAPEPQPKFVPPPIVTGSYAEKQLLVQAANLIDALIGTSTTPSTGKAWQDAVDFVEKVRMLYGEGK